MRKLQLSDFNIHDIGTTISLSGVLFSSAGRLFLVPFPESHDTINFDQDALVMDQDKWTEFLSQTDHLEVETWSPTNDGKIVKAIVRKSQRVIEQAVSWKVFRLAQYKCEYCGNDDVPLTVDHLVLWEHGGPSIVANLAAACRKCNKTRGNMTYSNWLRSKYYAQVSKNLTQEQRDANEARLHMLDSIPRVQVKSR